MKTARWFRRSIDTPVAEPSPPSIEPLLLIALEEARHNADEQRSQLPEIRASAGQLVGLAGVLFSALVLLPMNSPHGWLIWTHWSAVALLISLAGICAYLLFPLQIRPPGAEPDAIRVWAERQRPTSDAIGHLLDAAADAYRETADLLLRRQRWLRMAALVFVLLISNIAVILVVNSLGGLP